MHMFSSLVLPRQQRGDQISMPAGEKSMAVARPPVGGHYAESSGPKRKATEARDGVYSSAHSSRSMVTVYT